MLLTDESSRITTVRRLPLSSILKICYYQTSASANSEYSVRQAFILLSKLKKRVARIVLKTGHLFLICSISYVGYRYQNNLSIIKQFCI